MIRNLAAVVILCCAAAAPAQMTETKVPAGAKVYVASMEDGFDTFLKAALAAKKVPVQVVDKKEDAEYELSGHSETQKAGKAKKIIMWDWRSNEQASVQLSDVKAGVVVWAYSVNKQSSAHGKRSTAEACAKHLKEKIEAGK